MVIWFGRIKNKLGWMNNNITKLEQRNATYEDAIQLTERHAANIVFLGGIVHAHMYMHTYTHTWVGKLC